MPEYQLVKQSLNRHDRISGAITFRHRNAQRYRNLDDARAEAKRMARSIDDEQYETIYIVETGKGTVESWVRQRGNIKALSS